MNKTLKITCMLLALILLCSCTFNGGNSQNQTVLPSEPDSSNTDNNTANTDISDVKNDADTPAPDTSASSPSATAFRTYDSYDDIFDVINGNADITYGTFPPEASSADGSMTVITFNGTALSGNTPSSTAITMENTEYNINSGTLIISENGNIISEASIFTDSYTVGGDDDNATEYAYGYEDAASAHIIGNRLAIITSSYDYTETYDENSNTWIYGNKRASNVYIYDISDTYAPQFITKLSQDGALASYVFSGGNLYIVSSWFANKIDKGNIPTYIPHTYGNTSTPINAENIYAFEYSTCSGYTIITEYDVENSIIVEASAILGGSGRLYIDESDIYAVFFSETAELSTSYIEDNYEVEEYSEHCMSAIIKFSIADKLSSPRFTIVNGCFGNDFSIYTQDNTLYFCAVAEHSTYAVYTDSSSGWINKKDISAQVENVLYTISPDLTDINSAYLPNEEISSARFDGDTVWIGFYSGEQGFDIHTCQPISSENG